MSVSKFTHLNNVLGEVCELCDMDSKALVAHPCENTFRDLLDRCALNRARPARNAMRTDDGINRGLRPHSAMPLPLPSAFSVQLKASTSSRRLLLARPRPLLDKVLYIYYLNLCKPLVMYNLCNRTGTGSRSLGTDSHQPAGPAPAPAPSIDLRFMLSTSTGSP